MLVWGDGVLPEKCGVGDGLGVCGDEVMFFVGHVDISRLEGLENVFHQGKGVVRPAMLDEDLRCVGMNRSVRQTISTNSEYTESSGVRFGDG